MNRSKPKPADFRAAVRSVVIETLQPQLGKDLPEAGTQIGLVISPAAQGGPGPSKRARIEEALDSLVDEADYERVADQFLVRYATRGPVHRSIEDYLWWDRGPRIPIRARRELALAFGRAGYRAKDLYALPKAFRELWTTLFDDTTPSIVCTDLESNVRAHVHKNDDWDVTDLFEELGAFECVDHRFGKLIEGLVSSQVTPDVETLQTFARIVSLVLAPCRVELVQTEESEGYPVFKLVQATDGVAGRPKNVIFGGSRKPDLRLRDAMNNDIEIVEGGDEVLVYDRPIGQDGLRWHQLRAWWQDKTGCTREAASRGLKDRLRAAIPANSPPQRFLFETYAKRGVSTENTPAMLPEVWLHWDPKTVNQRGVDRLPRFRMDFLLLFSPSERVVIEVDGKHHYSDDNGPSPSLYASMVRADRALRLAGYEVYRFGAAELNAGNEDTIASFFQDLMKRHDR